MIEVMRTKKRGSLLILVVWVLVFFSILSLSLYRIVSSQIIAAKKLEERLISLYLAKAAVVYTRQQLSQDGTEYDTLYELRLEQEVVLGRGKFIYTQIDEESKININTVSEEVLSRLPGMNEEIVKALVKARKNPFQLKEEILLIAGITEEIFDQFKDFITVYSQGEVNINTAPQEVLRFIGMDEELIKTIEDYRKGEDQKEGTKDDGVFESRERILNQLQEFSILFGESQAVLIQLISGKLISSSSKNFSLKIRTEVLARPAVNYVIIMNEEQIKQWVEL